MSEIVIVGGGVAAASAAETLRDHGHAGKIQLFTDEPLSPYQRPPLSKGYLAGSEGLDAVLLHSDEWYRDRHIDVYSGVAVTGIDRHTHTVSLAGGATSRFDQLLLATGSAARPLTLPGANLPGVHTLRRIDDADRIAPLLRSGGLRVVVIGAGWIGMETAAVARALGNDVTILNHSEVPLASAVGAEMGLIFQRLHENHGTRVVTGVTAERIDGVDRASAVVAGGQRFPADLVIAGVGAMPNTALAEAAGLETGNGVLTDTAFRTSDSTIFAAGDVAHPMHAALGQRLRSEHWAFALDSGRAAARSILGQSVSFDWVPFFYSDQFDLGMELSGYPPLMHNAEVLIRGDLEVREFIAFWLQDGVVVGGMNVNIWEVNDQVQSLIRSGRSVDRAALTDPDVPLTELLVP